MKLLNLPSNLLKKGAVLRAREPASIHSALACLLLRLVTWVRPLEVLWPHKPEELC